MKRPFSVVTAVVGVVYALALPAGVDAETEQKYALSGQGRALDIAIGQTEVTLGFAKAKADSTPSAQGVGAGQCTLLGESPESDSLPCNEKTQETSSFPGNPGSTIEQCGEEIALPPPLDAVLALDFACGSSHSGIASGMPFSKNMGKIADLEVNLPLSDLLSGAPEAEGLVGDLTGALSPVLDAVPGELRGTVENLLETLEDLDLTQLLHAEVGPADANISSKGSTLKVATSSAGAKIGLLGLPSLDLLGSGEKESGDALLGDPIKDGLVIIEVATATASSTIDTDKVTADAEASPALVTVKVRDLLSPESKYITIPVEIGQTITLLEGTPLESTITAADSTVAIENNSASARAASDAVRLHLLKGLLDGGIKLGLARASSAAAVEDKPAAAPPEEEPPPGAPKAPDKVLPVTGGENPLPWALALFASSAALLFARRRLSAR